MQNVFSRLACALAFPGCALRRTLDPRVEHHSIPGHAEHINHRRQPQQMEFLPVQRGTQDQREGQQKRASARKELNPSVSVAELRVPEHRHIHREGGPDNPAEDEDDHKACHDCGASFRLGPAFYQLMFLLAILFFVFAIILIVSRKSVGEEQRQGLGVGILILFVLSFGVAISSGIKIVNAGNVGVVKLFGKVSPDSLKEGMHLVNPFATVEELSVRTQEYTMSGTSTEGTVSGDDSIRTLSKDGLPLPVDVTVTYRPVPSMVPWLYRNIGSNDDFVAKIVRPASRAAVRDGVSQFTAQEAYSSKREQLAIAITKRLESYITENLSKSEAYPGDAFIIQQVLVRNIELPDRLKQSIEAKLTAEQESLRMEYVLAKEKQEADRKRIEARGIADFQVVVSQGISDKLLLWKGIEATQELAKSTNSKVVIIGAGKSGLPVILNTDGAVTSAPK